MAVPSYDFSRTRMSSSPFAQGPSASPFGFNSPMGRSYSSGRSYWSPDRMAERYQKAQLQRMEGSGPFAGGSRGGGGGGYGGAPFQQPGAMGASPPEYRPEEVADMAAINFGNAPSLGQDYAQAQARLSTNMGGVGDLALIQQRNNPSMGSDYNQAISRQQYRSMLRNGHRPVGGLVAAAQRALFV